MKHLALSDIHIGLGGKMVDYAGFFMPVQYEGVKAEHKAVREAVGVFDVSHMGEIFINGKEASIFLQYITSNDIDKLKPGSVQYSCLPNLQNGIVDDILVYMLADQSYLLVVNASNLDKDFKWLNDNNSFDCVIENKSSEYSLLAVQGPESLSLLNKLTNEKLDDIKYYNFIIGNISGIENVIISRTGYTGEIGFELYVKNTDAIKLWNSLFSTSIKIMPIGLAARDTLRLEKGFCLYGNDINDTISPLEANLGWITKLDTNFINSDKLKLQKEEGIKKLLVGFEVIEKGVARSGYEIYDKNNNIIGNVTSGTMSPTLSKSIGLAYISKQFLNDHNTKFYVQVRNKKILAKLFTLPFVK
tara:strand:+ start:99 stop:1175 length:1077 start_codon:yes stop_codon:yes gene_type:complete